MRRNGNFIHENRIQPFDGPKRGVVIRVAGNDDHFRKRADEWSNGPAGLKSEPLPTERFADFITNVPGAEPDVFGITKAEIDVTDIQAVHINDAKMKEWNEAARFVARNNVDEPQFHSTER